MLRPKLSLTQTTLPNNPPHRETTTSTTKELHTSTNAGARSPTTTTVSDTGKTSDINPTITYRTKKPKTSTFREETENLHTMEEDDLHEQYHYDDTDDEEFYVRERRAEEIENVFWLFCGGSVVLWRKVVLWREGDEDKKVVRWRKWDEEG